MCIRDRVDLQDLSAHWVLMEDKRETRLAFGDPMQSPDQAFADEAGEQQPKMEGGGGGLQRGFMSKYAPDHLRPEDNRPEFAELNRLYNL